MLLGFRQFVLRKDASQERWAFEAWSETLNVHQICTNAEDHGSIVGFGVGFGGRMVM